jgi:hypothetical protein
MGELGRLAGTRQERKTEPGSAPPPSSGLVQHRCGKHFEAACADRCAAGGTQSLDAELLDVFQRRAQEEGTLAPTAFEPGSDWHAYRVEVGGERIRLLVDGALLLEATDERIRSAGSAGLFAGDLQLHVRSFTVIAL